MINQEAFEILKNINSKYLIIGYKPDGYRGIPATYELCHLFADNELGVCKQIKGLTAFRVFEIGKESGFESEWKLKADGFANKENEKAERAQLNYLKQKYENK
jgi:hypothetical protein